MVCVMKFLKFLQNSCEKELLRKLLSDDVINNKKTKWAYIQNTLCSRFIYTKIEFFHVNTNHIKIRENCRWDSWLK